jgi:hypothetical protein
MGGGFKERGLTQASYPSRLYLPPPPDPRALGADKNTDRNLCKEIKCNYQLLKSLFILGDGSIIVIPIQMILIITI